MSASETVLWLVRMYAVECLAASGESTPETADRYERICSAVESIAESMVTKDARIAQLEAERAELVALLRQAGPFIAVAGDAHQRINPGSRLAVNTASVWLVGSDMKTLHKAIAVTVGLNDLLARLDSEAKGKESKL